MVILFNGCPLYLVSVFFSVSIVLMSGAAASGDKRETGLNPLVFLLTAPRRFLCCSSLFVRLCIMASHVAFVFQTKMYRLY